MYVYYFVVTRYQNNISYKIKMYRVQKKSLLVYKKINKIMNILKKNFNRILRMEGKPYLYNMKYTMNYT